MASWALAVKARDWHCNDELGMILTEMENVPILLLGTPTWNLLSIFVSACSGRCFCPLPPLLLPQDKQPSWVEGPCLTHSVSSLYSFTSRYSSSLATQLLPHGFFFPFSNHAHYCNISAHHKTDFFFNWLWNQESPFIVNDHNLDFEKMNPVKFWKHNSYCFQKQRELASFPINVC